MTTEQHIAETKMFRQDLDAVLQALKLASGQSVSLGEGQSAARDTDSFRSSRERSLAITKLQEAIMWLGMDLKDIGAPNPYPQSYNPESPVVEPTADGLKL